MFVWSVVESHTTVVKKAIGEYGKVQHVLVTTFDSGSLMYRHWLIGEFLAGYWRRSSAETPIHHDIWISLGTAILIYFFESHGSKVIWTALHNTLLQLLKMVATCMSSVGPHGMFHLAAAVSDFYVPWDSMVWFTVGDVLPDWVKRLIQNSFIMLYCKVLVPRMIHREFDYFAGKT